MSERIPPTANDGVESYYPQLEPWLVEQLNSTQTVDPDHFNRLLLQGASAQQGAAGKIIELCKTTPDKSFLKIVNIIQHVEQMSELFGIQSTEQDDPLRAFSPRFEYANMIVPGLIEVPVADRNSLRDYLRGDGVTYALDSYMEDNGLYPRRIKRIRLDETGNDEDTNIGPMISEMDETYEPMLNWELFDTVEERYLNGGTEERYIKPEDTLEDVVMETADERIVPLLLRLEYDYFSTIANGSKRDLVSNSVPKRYFVVDGIVWELYTANTIRNQLADECKRDLSGFDPSNFDFAMFRQFYITEYISKYPKSVPVRSGVEDYLDKEIDRRFNAINGPPETSL